MVILAAELLLRLFVCPLPLGRISGLLNFHSLLDDLFNFAFFVIDEFLLALGAYNVKLLSPIDDIPQLRFISLWLELLLILDRSVAFDVFQQVVIEGERAVDLAKFKDVVDVLSVGDAF